MVSYSKVIQLLGAKLASRPDCLISKPVCSQLGLSAQRANKLTGKINQTRKRIQERINRIMGCCLRVQKEIRQGSGSWLKSEKVVPGQQIKFHQNPFS